MTGRNGIHWCASGGSCGKTTALRMVAGPENISAGTLRIAGKPVNNITPKDRDIAMVFQNYALYPHMTVAGNIAFALRMRKPARHLIDAKVRGNGRHPRPDRLAGPQARPAVRRTAPACCSSATTRRPSTTGRTVVAGIRPEHLTAARDGQAGPALAGDVDLVEALGSELVVHFTIDARRVRAEGATDSDAGAATVSGEGVARVDPATPVKPGERCTFAIDTSGMQFFDPRTGAAIWD